VMDNLHRELAPISVAAWADLEQEARRTFQRHVAGRRIVDVAGPAGVQLSAIGTGHLQAIDPLSDGIITHTRRCQPVVRLRVLFTVDRQQVDNVEQVPRTRTGSRSKTPPASSPSPRTERSSKGTRKPASPAFAPAHPTRRSRCRRTYAIIPTPSARP